VAKLLDQPCPQCGLVDELRIVSKLMARRDGSPDRFKLLVLWRPVLVCEACDLFVVGTYTPDGNHALFDSHGGGDGPVESEAKEVPAG
jgi:hypothetical protein